MKGKEPAAGTVLMELRFDTSVKGNQGSSYPAKTHPPSFQSQPGNLPISGRNRSARSAAAGRPDMEEDQGENHHDGDEKWLCQALDTQSKDNNFFYFHCAFQGRKLQCPSTWHQLQPCN